MKAKIVLLTLTANLAATATPARADDAIAPPPVRGVDISRELMITDLRVIEDPLRTNPRNGARATWTFKYLIEQMAGTRDPSDFALRWLSTWERDQFVNGFVATARPRIRELVIDPWLKASGGRRLDLAKAPFKLLAIVNRMDLRSTDLNRVDSAGEGRFVFGVLGADGKPLKPTAGTVPGGFMVIFEYELMARRMEELGEWARSWHDLGRLPIGGSDYNAALERITRRFSDRGAGAGKPNSSALNQLRTNEVSLGIPWELREFVIDGVSGLLAPHTVALTPDTVDLNGTANFADLVNLNESEILDGSFDLAPAYFGAASLSGPFQPSDFPDFATRTFTTNPLVPGFFNIPWSAAGIASNDARHALALNTCGGCHRDETGTAFLQIGFPDNHALPLTLRSPAKLAGFLTGITLPDPVDPATSRHFADLDRRRQDLDQLLSSFAGPGRLGLGPVTTRHLPKRVH